MKTREKQRKIVILIMAVFIVAILLYTVIRFDYIENPLRYGRMDTETYRYHTSIAMKLYYQTQQGIQSAILILIVLIAGGAALYWLKEEKTAKKP